MLLVMKAALTHIDYNVIYTITGASLKPFL